MIKSFRHAFHGLHTIFREERNFRIELGIGAATIAAMIILKVTAEQRIILLLLIFGVLSMEILNSVVEKLVDMASPRYAPYAKVIKDMMAGFVLTGAVAASVIGAYILLPYLVTYGSS